MLVAVLLTSALVAAASAATCSPTNGVAVKCAQAGHAGGQCSIIKSIAGGSPVQCCQACGLYPGCQFWVFNRKFNECYLKQGDSSFTHPNPDASWGFPGSSPSPSPAPPTGQCHGSRLGGQAIKCAAPGHSGGECTIIITLSTSSADQCCSWCAGNPACEFWVLDSQHNQCNLKRGDSTYIIQAGDHTSGVFKALPPNTWPSFANAAALQSSPWGTYFRSLYGDFPSAWPLDLRNFWCFYKDKMQAAGVNQLPQSVGQCPTSKVAPLGQRYDENNHYSSLDLTWNWHPLSSAPFSGFTSNSIVEISHQKDPFGDEHHGMWFLYAKGSGVFLDIGKTKIFGDHGEAFSFFKAKGNEDMCIKAAAQGYDTVQFIKHVDGVNYPCASKIGVPWMNMEIVAVKLIGTYACGQAQGTASALRAGWHGDRPCKCDPSNPNTNCVFSLVTDETIV